MNDLSLFLEGKWIAPDITNVLFGVYRSFPRLRSLSIQTKVYWGTQANIEVPAFPDLTRLRLSLPKLAFPGNTIKVSLKAMAGIHKLHALIIDASNLKREDLPQLDVLCTLIINNVDDSALISDLGELHTLTTLGLRLGGHASDFDAAIQTTINALPIKTLIWGFGDERHIKELPLSVEALYLGLQDVITDEPFEGEKIEYH